MKRRKKFVLTGEVKVCRYCNQERDISYFHKPECNDKRCYECRRTKKGLRVNKSFCNSKFTNCRITLSNRVIETKKITIEDIKQINDEGFGFILQPKWRTIIKYEQNRNS